MQELLDHDEKWDFFINTVGTALPGRPIQNIMENIIKDLKGDVIASVPMTPMVKKYTEFRQKMPRNADKFNFDQFETANSMYHDELLPYRTTIPKDRYLCKKNYGLKYYSINKNNFQTSQGYYSILQYD